LPALPPSDELDRRGRAVVREERGDRAEDLVLVDRPRRPGVGDEEGRRDEVTLVARGAHALEGAVTEGVRRFLREALTRGEAVNCFEDAFYSPTYFGDFLIVLEHLVENPVLGRRVYHACGQRISRYFFAKLFARAANLESSLIQQGSRITEKAPFIFADISLENTLTCESLDVSVGRHQEYLSFLGLTR